MKNLMVYLFTLWISLLGLQCSSPKPSENGAEERSQTPLFLFSTDPDARKVGDTLSITFLQVPQNGELFFESEQLIGPLNHGLEGVDFSTVIPSGIRARFRLVANPDTLPEIPGVQYTFRKEYLMDGDSYSDTVYHKEVFLERFLDGYRFAVFKDVVAK